MTILERLRNRPSTAASDVGPPDTAPAEGDQLPIARYEQLDDRKIVKQLAQLSQAELAAIETYERSHQGRATVLAKLRYLRGNEPLPGYDALEPQDVVDALAGADGETIRAVRDYERKFQRRKLVLDEVERVLPTAQASAGEDRARDEKDARIREGFAGREKTATGLADDAAGEDDDSPDA